MTYYRSFVGGVAVCGLGLILAGCSGWTYNPVTPGNPISEGMNLSAVRAAAPQSPATFDQALASDYADYAHPLAKRVSEGEADRGVLLCGTGLGMSYTANRYPHVRAAVAWTPEIASLAREHNDANVLVLPARFVGEDEGKAILKAWLETPFAGGRHARRVAKIERDANPTEESR